MCRPVRVGTCPSLAAERETFTGSMYCTETERSLGNSKQGSSFGKQGQKRRPSLNLCPDWIHPCQQKHQDFNRGFTEFANQIL